MIEFFSSSRKHHKHPMFCRLESGLMSATEFYTHKHTHTSLILNDYRNAIVNIYLSFHKKKQQQTKTEGKRKYLNDIYKEIYMYIQGKYTEFQRPQKMWCRARGQ